MTSGHNQQSKQERDEEKKNQVKNLKIGHSAVNF